MKSTKKQTLGLWNCRIFYSGTCAVQYCFMRTAQEFLQHDVAFKHI